MTIHVGLMGGGNISETHARAARAIPGLEIAAIYGTNRDRVERFTTIHGGTPYLDLDAFLNHKPMDFVAIGSPSGLHSVHGIAAARRGLHVLTEKPIEISTERADELIGAARESGVKLGVMFQDRFKPDIRRLKQWIDDGAIGKPLLIDARVKWYRSPGYYSESKWRGTLALDGGGALINQAVHTLDLLLWLFGDVVRVQARTATMMHAIQGEDTAIALLEFASGALGTVLADRIIAADLRDVSGRVNVSLPSGDSENVASPVVSDFSGHQAIFEDFVGAIRDNGTPACDGLEGRRSIALVEEIYSVAQKNHRK
jgi:UDP-N-acetyl-2-amino-2-deoxyglucuronate dehydrogenase